MELKIKISEEVYDAIKEDDGIRLDKVHELFDAIRNGRPVVTSPNKIDNLLILNEAEAKIFNSLTEEQRRVVGILLDNAKEAGQTKDATDKLVSKEAIGDHVEICRLMTVFLGRKFTPHEGHFMALYKTIEQNKEMFAGLKGEDKILVKMLIRSLVPTEE